MYINVCRLDFTYITLLILLQTPIFYHSHTSQEITKATDVKAMAFERPVEADRVDDLGLLSSLVRGPIMWMLGGDRDKQADKPADATLMLPPRPPMRSNALLAYSGERRDGKRKTILEASTMALPTSIFPSLSR